MAEVWVKTTAAAREVGYVVTHVQRLVRRGVVKARRPHPGARWLVELNSLRHYATQGPIERAENCRKRRVATWLLNNKALWSMNRTELRNTASNALGFEVKINIMHDATKLVQMPPPTPVREVLERWIVARPYVLEERPSDAFRIWRDELPVDVARCTFERAYRNVSVTMEHDEESNK